jgi:hypothetical protein
MRAAHWRHPCHWKVDDLPLVDLLGLGRGELGIDSQAGSGGMAAVGLDERVIDAPAPSTK